LQNLAKFANYPHLFLVTKNQSPKTASMANMAAAEVDDIAAIKPILQD